MKKRILTITLLLVSLLGFSQSEHPKVPKFLVLKNANIINVISGETKKGLLLIKDEKIEAIDYTGNLSIPEGAVTYDLIGKYIIPGLIDLHVHITHGTFDEAKESLELGLRDGVTGVRDMGGDGRMLTLLKKNAQIGELTGSDVFFSTIIAGPKFFENDPRPQSVALGAKAGEVSWQRAITTETDFKQIVAEAKGLGVTAIKMYDYLDKELIKKVSDEAKKQGLMVWSHAAVPPTKPSDVVLGGSQVISHAGAMIPYELLGNVRSRSSFKDKEEAQVYRKQLKEIVWDANTPQVKDFFNLVQKNNVILDATLHVYTYDLDKQINGQKIDSTSYKEALKVTKLAYEMGVKIGAGSDDMITIGEYGQKVVNIHNELSLLVRAGLSTIAALRSGTIINAEAVGQDKNIGSIEVGKLANLVVLEADPLTDISNTKKIKYVIKRGKLIETK